MEKRTVDTSRRARARFRHSVPVIGLIGVMAGILTLAGVQPALASSPPSGLTETQWQHDIAQAPTPAGGCYQASYPSLRWQPTQCSVAPAIPMAPSRRSTPANGRPVMTVGTGHDYSAVVSGTISSATGSFVGVSPDITEKGQLGGTGAQFANTYSLQLNTEFFDSPACSGATTPSACLGWQQFIYSSYTNSAFMQYWLITYSSTCPSGWNTYFPDCYTTSAAIVFSGGKITAPELATTELTGSASAGGEDEVTLASGDHANLVTNSDSKLDLANYWNTSEFNVFGDGGGGQAKFGSTTTFEAQTALTDGSQSAPQCKTEGFTAETNNLSRTATPAIGTRASPTIAFQQTDETATTPSCATAAGSTASKLKVTAQPESTTVGHTFIVGVSIENSAGDVLSANTTTVGLKISAGTTGATLTCTGSTTDRESATSGVATFHCKLNRAATGYKLTATSGGLTAATTTAFTVTTPPAPTQLAITTQPGSTVTGHAFSVGVSVESSLGTVVTTATTTVALAITSGTTGATLTCTGSTTDRKHATSGVASFSCTLQVPHTGYKLTASSGGLTPATTGAFTITGATTATKLAVTTEPAASSQAKQAFTVGVSVENAAGTVLTTRTTAVTLGIKPETGTAGATLTCITDPQAASAGVASFSCSIDKAGSGYMLTASASGLSPATTNPFAVTPTPTATKLDVTSEPPASAPAGLAFTVRVSIENATSTVVTTKTTAVTLRIKAGTGTAAAALSCSGDPEAASAGVASFSCSIDKAGSGYMLTASASGLSPATTNPFAVTATSGGGGGSTAPTPPPAPTGTSSHHTCSVSSGVCNAANDTVEVTGVGLGALTVAQYRSDPEGAPSFASASEYFDVAVSTTNAFTSISIKDCNLNGGSALYWWNPVGNGAWETVSPVFGPSGSPPCLTAELGSTSVPSISELKGTVIAVGSGTANRIYGATADATAAAELEHQFPSTSGDCPGRPGTRPVVLATDATYADALSSAYLARYLGTGTLLTPPAALSSATLTAIHEEGITKVDIVGGPLAVSTAVVTQLQSTLVDACGGTKTGGTDIQVARIWGTTQYTTAEKIAEAAPSSNVGKAAFPGAYAGTNTSGGQGRYNDTAGRGSTGPDETTALPTAIVATGTAFQDAESASTLAYADNLPVLLTTPSTLSSQISSVVTALGIRQVIVMGGQLAVSNGVVSSLEALGVSVLRVAGQTYSATSVELAQFECASASAGLGLGWAGTGSLSIARGNGFTDGLAGAVVAASGPGVASPEPLVLTLGPGSVGSALASFLQSVGTTGLGGARVTQFTILGGPLAIATPTVSAMEADL